MNPEIGIALGVGTGLFVLILALEWRIGNVARDLEETQKEIREIRGALESL